MIKRSKNGFDEHEQSKYFNFPLFRCGVDFFVNYLLLEDWGAYRSSFELETPAALRIYWTILLDVFTPRKNQKLQKYSGDEIHIGEKFGIISVNTNNNLYGKVPDIPWEETTHEAMERRTRIASKAEPFFLPSELSQTREKNLRLLREYMIAKKENGLNVALNDMKAIVTKLESATPYKELVDEKKTTAQLQIFGLKDSL